MKAINFIYPELTEKLVIRNVRNGSLRGGVKLLDIIARQNDLKLCLARDFQTCKDILIMSINLN